MRVAPAPTTADVRSIVQIRADSPEQAVATAQRCWTTGIDLVAVPLQRPHDLDCLQAVCAVAGARPAAADGVDSVPTARRAVESGAWPLLSPALDPELVAWARAQDVTLLPGVATPTEAARAAAAGVEACQLFPAGPLGADFLSAVDHAFPRLRFVASGGVTRANAHELVAAGAAALILGRAADVLDGPATLATTARIREPWPVPVPRTCR